MKGSQATSSPPGPPEGSLEGLDLSLTGLPPPMSRRPNSASAAKPVARSISVATGSEPKRKALEATGPGSSRAINNLRRSSSTTQVHQPQAKQAWASPLRPAEPPDFLMLFESSSGGNQRPAGVSRASSEKGATWNVLDDQPRALPSPPAARSPCALDTPAGPRRREGTVSLAPNFTANNRSNKAAVGNFVTTMVHNNHGPADAAPKSSNRTAPSLNNLVKAATREGEGSGGGKPQKNSASSNHGARNNAGAAGGLLRRREVTEEEAERFIHQVNQAAITIQRWYRYQAQRRRAQATSLGHLLASKLEPPLSQGQQKRRAEGDLLDLHRQREAARKKAREEKARQARRAAIQELQQKRAQKSGHGTQEPGKPQPAQEPPLRPGDSAQQPPKANNTGASSRTPGPEDPCQPIPDASPEAQRLPDDKPQDTSAQDAAGEALETGGPGSRAQCRATLDELLDTLRLLEEAPEPLPRPGAYHKDRYAWSDEEDDASSLTADNLEKFGKLSAPAGPPEDGTLLSEAKLQSIMCFLDEMEQSGRERPAAAPLVRGSPHAHGSPQASGSPRVSGSPQGLAMEEGGPRCLESASEVSASVMRLKLEVEEKKQAMALLQRALAQQRDLTIRRVKETEKELGRQLRQQREHYEATIQRHLSFIDQLIEDKKTLGEKCAAVVAELKQGEQRRQEREAQMREQHALEIKKLKELMSATEKVRREKWMNEKTRKIKEITVRGAGVLPGPPAARVRTGSLQRWAPAPRPGARDPEADRQAQAGGEEAAQPARGRAAAGGRAGGPALRAPGGGAAGAAGAGEGGAGPAGARAHPAALRAATGAGAAGPAAAAPAALQRGGRGEGAAGPAGCQRVELEDLRQQLEESSAARARALRAELDKGREELEQRHQMELQALKDQLEVERQLWEANCAKKEEAWLLSRERELKEEIRRGRDKDIELVIRRLEADMTQAREESERAAESRVKRLRDQHEAELAELEQAQRRLQDQCAELRGRLAEAEGEGVRLQGLVRQKDRALAEAKAVNEQLAGERSGLAQVLRLEFADRLAASEEENRQVRAELAELRAQQRLELEQLRREKQAELEDVHARVKAALAKKEEAVSSLRKQHQAAVKRADHLEELLEQRRRPLPSAK
ncbi:centrosomal protein of 131 kDa isoform X3 [Myotis myotis]|nr:centrosomal protein of 131 kDa isoform X3 [Myotis myotis]XP_036198066.1 centrosomal protein of 131 kDa isoform X3 [Myotis myotis]XP_036198067.1 centrosomal protein of 131 kDa isoform X3 [Myotis myotis]